MSADIKVADAKAALAGIERALLGSIRAFEGQTGCTITEVRLVHAADAAGHRSTLGLKVEAEL